MHPVNNKHGREYRAHRRRELFKCVWYGVLEVFLKKLIFFKIIYF